MYEGCDVDRLVTSLTQIREWTFPCLIKLIEMRGDQDLQGLAPNR